MSAPDFNPAARRAWRLGRVQIPQWPKEVTVDTPRRPDRTTAAPGRWVQAMDGGK
jgi:hypothetical protein